MFTIKSESEEGTYFLCNHWNKNKTFWVEESKIKPDMLFKTEGLANRSLNKLLKIMPEYSSDKFTSVEI
ncbi:hypothetical protein AALB39_04325 [Lachnospiraceae bacterium 54-53]